MDIQRGLPFGAAPFIGRERERARLADLVVRTRMVTLTGSGGCGKTRFALEMVEDVASWCAEGTR